MPERATCPTCRGTVAVTTKGLLRVHPKGVEAPCVGSGHAVSTSVVERPIDTRQRVPGAALAQGVTFRESVVDGAETAKAAGDLGKVMAPAESPRPAVAVPGTYQSREHMLAPGLRPPPGHATVAVVFVYPYDGSNGRLPVDEAALLYEDPAYLYEVLSAASNRHVRVTLKVEDR